MNLNEYLGRQYSAQPCWELVADFYDRELGAIPVDYKTINRSIREMASAFRLAIHKSAHGFVQVADPVDMCIVLLGKSSRVGIHHCGIFYEGRVLHALPDNVMYQELSVIGDAFGLVEFWAKP